MKRWLALIALTCCSAHADELRVNDAGQVEAHGTDVRVFRGEAKTPLFGGVTHAGDIVRFAPTLPFVAGESYRVEVQTADGSWQTHALLIPRPDAQALTVSMLASDAAFPANALKFYLQFSQPMEQGVFLERISLHRLDGSPVPGAFRETELWSPDGRRLTLWLHPGRQKTGVNLNTDEGPVLSEGEMHTLRIASSWRSVEGTPLGKELTFPIKVAAADHQCPDPQRWKITAPTRGTRDSLHLLFDEPLDPAMLYSALQVRCGDEALQGAVHLPPDARSWSFTPAQAWLPGRYEIIVDPLLEDLAGNNLQQPFEVDRGQPVKPTEVIAPLPFEVR